MLRAPPHDPDEPQNDEHPEGYHQPVGGGVVGVVPGLRPLLELGRIAGQCERDVVHAVLDAAGVVAGAEARQDRGLDDDLRQRVGQDRLEAAADLDAHLPLVGRDDEQDAIVLLLGADAPMAPELIAEILDA